MLYLKNNRLFLASYVGGRNCVTLGPIMRPDPFEGEPGVTSKNEYVSSGHIAILILASQEPLRGPYLCAVSPLLQWGKGEGRKKCWLHRILPHPLPPLQNWTHGTFNGLTTQAKKKDAGILEAI